MLGKEKITTSRIEYIDIAKGFAILLVVMGHLTTQKAFLFQYSGLLKGIIYSFHMPLFFMLSGYLNYVSDKKSELTSKRISKLFFKYLKKLLGTYFLWSGVYYLLFELGNNINHEEWFWCVFTLRGRAPLWFLGALFLAEVFFLGVRVVLKKRMALYVILSLVTGAITIYLANLENILHPGEIEYLKQDYIMITIFRFFPCLFFVIAGYIMAYILYERIYYKYLDLFIGILSGAAILFIQIKTENRVNLHLFNIQNPIIFLSTGLLGSICVIMISKQINKILKMKILCSLGKNTLGIMLLHYIPFPTMLYTVNILSRFEGVPHYVLLAIGTVVATGFSYIGIFFVKKKLLI